MAVQSNEIVTREATVKQNKQEKRRTSSIAVRWWWWWWWWSQWSWWSSSGIIFSISPCQSSSLLTTTSQLVQHEEHRKKERRKKKMTRCFLSSFTCVHFHAALYSRIHRSTTTRRTTNSIATSIYANNDGEKKTIGWCVNDSISITMYFRFLLSC